jgi:CRAL/TRIO domain/CRAL/TRIO, N-terminal domain
MQVSDEKQNEGITHLVESLKTAQRYSPERHDDATLLRFLRARRFDLEKAEKMLLECEDWRVETNVDEIVKSFTFTEEKAVAAIYPRHYHKTDKFGRPIYIERLETLDCKKLFDITTQERLITRHVREYEKLMRYRFVACSKKEGRRIEQGTTILDLKGVPLSQFNQVRKVVNSVSAIAQNYYPETLGKMFIINAPTLFTAIWTVIKTMLDENTVAKISVLGSSYKKELLEVIDAENLPAMFGGSCQKPLGDVGPWNDGTVADFPQAFWEDIKKRDGC